MILLVEDDAIARINFAGSLGASGYGVLEAADGAEALNLLERRHDEIEIVITDMVLPKVNGFTLLSSIEAKWPKIPVVMISGYLSQETGRAILGPRVDVLEKPFRPSALHAIVQRKISGPQNP